MAGHKDTSAATHFGRQMKKERLAHGWSLQELSTRTAYDGAHLSRIENGLRPPTRALALACDAAFPERRGWFTDYYDESRRWAEVPPGFRDWSEIEDKTLQLRAWSRPCPTSPSRSSPQSRTPPPPAGSSSPTTRPTPST